MTTPAHERTIAGSAGIDGQGPYFAVSLTLTDGVITGIRCRGMGCMWSDLTGLALASLLDRRTLPQAAAVDEPALRARLEGLPPRRDMLPGHAIAALHMALRQAGDPLS